MHVYTHTYIQNGLDGSATAKIFTRRPGFVVALLRYRFSLANMREANGLEDER